MSADIGDYRAERLWEVTSLADINDLFDQPVSLKGILDELPIGVLVLNPERQIVLTNNAADAMTGFDGEEVQGIPCCYILRTNLCQRECLAICVQDTGEPTARNGNIITRDRRKVPIRLTSAALKNSQDNLVGFLETFEDITHLQTSDEKLVNVHGFGSILGQSAAMEALFRMIPVVAQTDSSILTTGETGTGKDLLAEAIHQASDRAGGPFIKINCGALPETLLESELFGHTKGAFTGAVENKPGRIRLAHNGTLYLTEIGDLPLQLQVKLLTFLDDKVVYSLGSAKGFRANVRIIAATHRDLEGMVREGSFREDLLYRLNVVHLHLPPLRERDNDIILLLDHFLHRYASHFNKRIRGYSSQLGQILKDYKYPGNVRELRNIVEYATSICPEELLNTEHLPAYLTQDRLNQDRPMHQPEPKIANMEVTPTEERTWEEIERQLILSALVKTKGRRGEAAQLLGWARSTLWRKMKQHDISS
ncbi:MAG: PAS domain-containing protein [Proteobacteria bacterium]|nr:PAS domain-containing protein [Pseudomonadota bacterium]